MASRVTVIAVPTLTVNLHDELGILGLPPVLEVLEILQELRLAKISLDREFSEV